MAKRWRPSSPIAAPAERAERARERARKFRATHKEAIAAKQHAFHVRAMADPELAARRRETFRKSQAKRKGERAAYQRQRRAAVKAKAIKGENDGRS
jgi:hypothetical protein